jgi:hypothetical protein
MLSIDADAHVIETEKTWDYLEGSDRPTGRCQSQWTCRRARRKTFGSLAAV